VLEHTGSTYISKVRVDGLDQDVTCRFTEKDQLEWVDTCFASAAAICGACPE
jgi:hypothetical protein